MPNLRQFIVVVIYRSSVPLTWTNLFDGYQWQQILTNNTPYLDTFNISIWVEDINLIPDVNTTLKSFDYFTNKYKDWYVAIERPFSYQNHQSKTIEKRKFTERSYSIHGLFRITNLFTWI
jgi:hypothetical protein